VIFGKKKELWGKITKKREKSLFENDGFSLTKC
jgi:hypothetical protein